MAHAIDLAEAITVEDLVIEFRRAANICPT
jgi:hypothetical protein